MSHDTNQGEVYFALRSEQDFDPAVVTQRLGIEPTRVFRKADLKPNITSWVLSSGKVTGEVVDVYEISGPLVSRLMPLAEPIRQLMLEFGLKAVLQVVLHISMDESKSTPAIGFDSPTVKFLGAVGASIDVDTYRV